MKRVVVTYYIEPADGQPERVTGIHVEDERVLTADGRATARWMTGAALDSSKPAGSPHSRRTLATRAINDHSSIPEFVPAPVVTPKPAPKPGPDDFVA